jgi:hypothetical protein
MSGRVLIEWKNVPSRGRKKYSAPMMKITQAKSFPSDGARRFRNVVAAAMVSTASG